MPARRSAQQVDETMGVARYEIDRTVTNALILHQRFDRRPPPAGGLDVTDLRAAEHANGEAFLLRLDAPQRAQQVAPDLHKSDRVILGNAEPLQNLELFRHRIHPR